MERKLTDLESTTYKLQIIEPPLEGWQDVTDQEGISLTWLTFRDAHSYANHHLQHSPPVDEWRIVKTVIAVSETVLLRGD